MKTPKKQQIKRKHNFPDAELYNRCMEMLRIYHLHEENFSSVGYTREDAKRLNKLADQFSALPTDDDYLGRQMVLTDKKTEAHRNLEAAIRELMNGVGRAYDSKSGHYRRFGTLRLCDQSSEKMLFTARNVVRVANSLWPALQAVDVAPRLLERIRQRTQELQEAMMHQVDAISVRDIAAEERIESSNQLYDQVMKLSEVGKKIFTHSEELSDVFTMYESNMEYKRRVGLQKSALQV